MLGYDEFFPIQATYSTGTNPYSVAVGDFNNDIRLDIVVTNLNNNTVSVLLGYGNGSFADQVTYSTGAGPISVAVGDLNNDNQLDIVVVNFYDDTVSVFMGYDNGSFANQTKYSTGSSPWSAAVDDFNNDTYLDIVVANYGGNTINVLLGYGNGSFANQMTYSTGSNAQSVAVGDLNNDTRLDIVVVNYGDNTISILLGYGNGSFANQTTYSTGSNPCLLDIVVVNHGSNNIGLLLGHGTGTFGNQMVLSTGLNSNPYTMAIRDFNKDGQADIAVTNYGSKNLVMFLGSGNGTFENRGSYGVDFDFAPLVIGAGSFNKDGRSEIFVAYDGIGHLYSSWKAKDITTFALQTENPLCYTTRNALRRKVWRILKRNKVKHLPKSSAPRTTTTIEYIQAEVKSSLKLKWWKQQTVQKLTTNQKVQRIIIAKRLSKKYGTKKKHKLYEWIYLLNTDFSNTFTLIPQYNQHNEGVYAESTSDTRYELKTKSKQKFHITVMFWGGISYQGLFSKKSPIFIDECLELIRPEGDNRHKKMYFIGDRYAKFIRTTMVKKAPAELDDLQNVIFQDDQDRIQKMQVVLGAVKHFIFINRIEPIDCATKLADVWSIENV
ncbi:unnamed protein product [Rotaria sordida]|uniref:VCBS repeat-containing protein n=1 Tax=Rotaria sordida TaxID=392033 RepID=A0A814NPC1_9BILA|nr:unnamed protein product [Rotaria sordida]